MALVLASLFAFVMWGKPAYSRETNQRGKPRIESITVTKVNRAEKTKTKTRTTEFRRTKQDFSSQVVREITDTTYIGSARAGILRL